jgi:hypothetical protein
MEETIQSVEVRMIDQAKYKETHGLYIDGNLQYRGTEHECRFFQLKLLQQDEQLSKKENQ